MGDEQVYGGTRRVHKLGDSLAVTLPHDFVIACNIKEGDNLPCFWGEKAVRFCPARPVRKPAPVKS